MNAPFPVRAKLIAAALSLLTACSHGALHGIGMLGSIETALKIAWAVFGVVLTFWGVFRIAQLQLLWGWAAAVVAPIDAGICIFILHGSNLIWGLFATLGALVGSYLLLVDTDVRDYRQSITKNLNDENGYSQSQQSHQ